MSAPDILYPPPVGGGTPVGGTGTANTIPRWTGASTLGDSGLIDNGTAIYTTTRNAGIGTATPVGRADVAGTSVNQSGWGLLSVQSNDAQGADKGGSITFGGVYDASTATHWAQISGRKENGTSGQYGGYLAFATRTNGAGTNTERARIDSSGNVGIGTASPGTRLHVVGGSGVRVTDATGIAGFDMLNIGNDAYLYNRNNGVLVFGTNNTARMRIHNAGATEADSQVAIGTTTFASGARLSLGGASSTTVKISYLNGSSEIGFSSMNGSSGECRHQAGLNVGGWGGFHTFYTDTTEKARIDSTGNVGIGTASPGTQLHISRAGGTSNAEYLRLQNTSVGSGSAVGFDQYVHGNTVPTGRIQHAWNGTTYDTVLSVWNNAGAALTEAVRIQGGGNVILNTANTGATIQAAGSQQGLKLPATPGNADTQTLDCYQEVTNWVPTVTFGTGGTVSYTVHTGYYVRVGRLVTFSLRVDFTVTAAPTGGDLQITLPVAAAVDQYFGTGNFNGLPGSTTQGPLYVAVGVSSTANIRKANAVGGLPIASAITASSTFIVTGTYIS